MRRAGQGRFITILAPNIQDEWAAGIAKSHDIAEAKKQIAVAKIGAGGGERVKGRKRISTVDMHVGVIHLLGDVMIAENLIKFREGANLAVGCGFVVSFLAVD